MRRRASSDPSVVRSGEGMSPSNLYEDFSAITQAKHQRAGKSTDQTDCSPRAEVARTTGKWGPWWAPQRGHAEPGCLVRRWLATAVERAVQDTGQPAEVELELLGDAGVRVAGQCRDVGTRSMGTGDTGGASTALQQFVASLPQNEWPKRSRKVISTGSTGYWSWR